MKKYSFIPLLLILSLFMVTSCDWFVEGIDPLIDSVEDSLLNNEDEVDFSITGVFCQWAYTWDYLSVYAGIMSDAFFFDTRMPGSSYSSFDESDRGVPQYDHVGATTCNNNFGELRFYGDNLLDRAAIIGTFADETVEDDLLFFGNFFGGIARHLYATYLGLEETRGGGFNEGGGPWIEADDMYDLAIASFEDALTYADDYYTAVTNSLIARCYLYNGDAASAEPYALAGMADGDDPFGTEHNAESDNYWWQQAGAGRMQVGAADRFNDYVVADPNEANRIPIEEYEADDGTIFWMQVKYPDQSTFLPFITWQENELMLAEIEIGDGANASALARINAVRASHGIDPLADLGADPEATLIEERDKELFAQGQRLPDQRRFDLWHLGADTWQYLPVVEDEYNINENISL